MKFLQIMSSGVPYGRVAQNEVERLHDEVATLPAQQLDVGCIMGTVGSLKHLIVTRLGIPVEELPEDVTTEYLERVARRRQADHNINA